MCFPPQHRAFLSTCQLPKVNRHWSVLRVLTSKCAFRHSSAVTAACIFPECVARVPVSLWGSGGWECVRSTLRSRSQPSATVRNRSQPFVWGPYGRAYGKFCRGGHFWRFQTSRCFLSRGRRGTSWHFVAGAILLRRFQKMCCIFRGKRSTFDVSIVIFRGRRSTLDVSCCVFFVNRNGRAASSGDKVQIPWQPWHFVRCAENWRKPSTKHRFWSCKFSCSKENS